MSVNRSVARLVSNRGRLQHVVRGSSLFSVKRYFSATTQNAKGRHDDFEEQMMELQEEREALFGFTDKEKEAWSQRGPSNNNNSETVGSFIEQHQHLLHVDHDDEDGSNLDTHENSQRLTHLSRDQKTVSMVNVGNKLATQRMARAQSKVVFPPEVMHAFQQHESSDELVGPKGPIFATAKLAGIMAAKRTSDLIPLCHPLPLEKVDLDIRLEGNEAVIECECHVTHKTGVEMEALTGASVAALTIYDMVKAISHRVSIEETILLRKTGGKRNVGNEDEEE